jgi:hypothetical protein
MQPAHQLAIWAYEFQTDPECPPLQWIRSASSAFISRFVRNSMCRLLKASNPQAPVIGSKSRIASMAPLRVNDWSTPYFRKRLRTPRIFRTWQSCKPPSCEINRWVRNPASDRSISNRARAKKAFVQSKTRNAQTLSC